ncbi:MAG: NOP5/NOP56 family protein [Candidatus Hodarchaeales archaeon]
MKYIQVTTVGILIGEKNEDGSPFISKLMLFDQKDGLADEILNDFMKKNESEILVNVGPTSDEIVSDHAALIDFLRIAGYSKARFANTGELFPFRRLTTPFLTDKLDHGKVGPVSSVIRERAMAKTSVLLREKVEARDVYIAQAINAIDDINSILNLIYARLSEWYGIHFPELQDLVRDNPQYIKLISKMGGAMRSSLDEELLKHLSDKRSALIVETANRSLGSEISKFDMSPISQFANFGVEILKIKENLEFYIEESMKEIAPNIQCIVGSLLGARLISLAGSLLNLAKCSSGTVQVLGAEKALFRHLRSGEDPPKHGVIFQSPFIHSAKKHQRGKIARALSAKLSMAARVDYFSGEFIGTTLLQDLEQRVEKIKSSFPEPSERQLTQKKKRKKFKRKSTYKGKYRDKKQQKKPARNKKYLKKR